MTTEEKLKISKNTCIHCPTLKLAEQVLNIFHKLDLKWCSEKDYIICTNWDSHKENTVYYPFHGTLSSLEYAQDENYKTIHAEKFIALHTKEKEFDLENYTPKGELEGFPKEIISRMLECQVEQGNPRNVSVFEKDRTAAENKKGFVWRGTKEDYDFWAKIIVEKNFDLFFEKDPKQDNQDNLQEFKVGDEVIDIIRRRIGKIIDINTLTKDSYPISVEFNDNEVISFTLDGRDYIRDKYPRLLHYRDDYDYSVIDFNNLPRRQEYKKWRAEKGQRYYYIDKLLEVSSFMEENHITDTKLYNLGNYFQTEKEAQEVVDIIKKCFQEEHE